MAQTSKIGKKKHYNYAYTRLAFKAGYKRYELHDIQARLQRQSVRFSGGSLPGGASP